MSSENYQTLESLWRYMSALSPSTTPETLTEIAQLFSATGNFYLNGMSAPPCTSHESLITTVQTLLTYWQILEMKIVSHIEQGDTIVNAMDNKIAILGEEIDGLPECEVVKFDEAGKICEYLLYADPGRIMAVFAKKAEGKKD